MNPTSTNPSPTDQIRNALPPTNPTDLHSDATAGPDRWAPSTHAHSGDLIVFNIGMTINKPHRPDLWWPVVAAMPKMIAELSRNRAAADRGEAEDLGFLAASPLIGGRGPWVVQYWRSTEHLYAYAHDRTAEHLPAWRAFNKAARRHPGAAGVWHETYSVPASGIETIYSNGARVGLGAATGTVPVLKRGRSARERLGGAAAH